MSEEAVRVLVVASIWPATPALLEAVRRRAARGPATFTLLVPNAAHGLHKLIDPEDQGRTEAEAVVELAVPLLEEAAGAHVASMIGVPEPLAAIQDAVNVHGFDELIISTLPQRVSKWLHLDLPAEGRGPRPAGHDRDRVEPQSCRLGLIRARATSLMAVNRLWIYMQVIIVVCVVASFVIALIKL